jgi:uncharacterized RDD family membrane protein YckC
MKCPKCGYIGFEPAERCRNCGYDFSLAIGQTPAPELSLTKDEPTSPVVDLPLGPRDAGASSPDREFSETPRGIPGPPTVPRHDLPLFAPNHESDDDRPLITPSPTPRAPLAVRRTPPPATRQHARTSHFYTPTLGLKPDAQPDTREAPEPQTSGADTVPAATAGRRLAAAAIDLLILGALDAGVLYFTLRLCRLAAIEVFILPVAPLLLFFLILNGGYLLAFTAAGGQTIGKMAVGIKVVAADAGPLTLGQAAVRAIGCILGVVPAGLGFVPFLLVPGRRALHDRLAGTWVVKVSTP